jgi:hypothetical protein
MDKWYGCTDADKCSATVRSPFKFVSISASVGARGANVAKDVREIQQALNQVPLAQGGPSPPLAVDGICGPLTTSAIQKFQQVQFPGWTPDARIDPKQKTIRRLNAILIRGSVVLPPTTDVHGVGQLPEIQKAYATIPEVLGRIRRAKARLYSLRASLALPDSLFASRQERAVAEWNFKLHRASDPEAHLTKILAIFDRMDETLVMASRQGTSFQFFLPSNDSPMEDTAAAYTTLGGYYYGIGEVKDDGEYRNAVYITPQFVNKQFAASILIHELSHFCGGKEKSPDTIEHRASPRPQPNGRRLEDGHHDYSHMTADEAYRNAQSYQAYSFPETDGKPPS